MAMPAAAARPRPLRPRRGSRQTAGRACLQIDQICTHNECTRHNSTAAPGGSRATIVTSDRHAARLVFQSTDEPSRFFLRSDRSLTVMRDSCRSPGSAYSETPVICASFNSAVAANCRRVVLIGRLVKVTLLPEGDQVLQAR